MTPNSGVTLESLLHKLQLLSGMSLAVVPGRPPVCLRCRRAGRVRKNCDVPKCESCHNFGPKKEASVRTYATGTAGQASFPANDLLMDEAETEAASQSVKPWPGFFFLYCKEVGTTQAISTPYRNRGISMMGTRIADSIQTFAAVYQ